MKILALDVVPSAQRGGQELSLFDELVELARRGHAVTLAHVEDGDLLPRYRAAGVRTLQLPAIEIRPRARVASTFGLARAVLRAARVRADVVCVNQYHDTLFGTMVAKLSRAPLVCHLRLRAPGSMCTQWRLGVPNVSRFIAISRAVAGTWIAERGVEPEAIAVAHDGIDMEIFAPRDSRVRMRAELGIPESAYVVLAVGRIDRIKNLETLLRAFAKLDDSEARLLIAGTPVNHGDEHGGEDYLRELRALAESLGISRSVHWLGSRRDVPDLLAASDVATLFCFYEGLGRVTIEALACERPIIASQGGGTDEILTGEFARLRFEATDATTAARLLRELRDWQRTDPELGARARRHAKANFSVAAKVTAVERAFAHAIADSGPHGPRGEWLRREYPERELAAPAEPGALLAIGVRPTV